MSKPIQEIASETGSSPISRSTLEGLAGFYAALGRRMIVKDEVLWFDCGAFSTMSVLTTVPTGIADREVRGILCRTRKLAAVYRVAAAAGLEVPMFMLRDKDYGPANLQRQFRQHVERASSFLEARECSWEEWETRALDCDWQTIARQGGSPKPGVGLLCPEVRRRIAEAGRAVPRLRIHACFHGKEIAAYLIHVSFGGMCEGLLANRVDSEIDSPTRHASHLLYFSFAKAAISDPDIQSVCVGRQSIPAKETLTRFKRHAGFLPEPCHLRFRLHPVLAPFLENQFSAALLKRVRLGLSGKIPALANLEVMEKAGLCGRR
jgi:hypothetical protein